MSLFGLAWLTSCISCFATANQVLMRVPTPLLNAKPVGILAVNEGINLLLPSVILSKPNLPLWRTSYFQSAVNGINFDSFAQTPTYPAFGESFPKNTFRLSKPVVISQPQFDVANPINKKPTINISQIWQSIQNLLPWRKRNQSINSISAIPSIEVIKSNRQNKNDSSWFEVRVNRRLVAKFLDKTQANLLANQLKDLALKSSLDADKLQPALIHGIPAGMWESQVLFIIDKDLATALKSNSELLTIEWINNLRVALNASSLKLADAQSLMYSLVETPNKIEGLASWYGSYFHGRDTATGEKFNRHELTAAHPSLPFNTYLKVTNQKNGNSVVVRINDRGPYVGSRTLDLSQEAARCLGSEKVGVVPVKAVVMKAKTGTVVN